MKNYMKKAAVQTIGQLRGSTLEFITGFDVRNGFYSDLIVIACSNDVLALRGEILISDFQGFDDEFSTISVNEAPKKTIDTVIESEVHYLQQKNSEILDIQFVIAHFTHFENGDKTWSYETEIGIIIETSKGYVNISKNSVHNEILEVEYLDARPSVEDFTTSHRFETNIFKTTAVEYRALAIDDFLELC
ncbi:MAG: hypothetical protein RL196_937 [Actinomycetota bacterium]